MIFKRNYLFPLNPFFLPLPAKYHNIQCDERQKNVEQQNRQVETLLSKLFSRFVDDNGLYQVAHQKNKSGGSNAYPVAEKSYEDQREIK